ncbi:hypothetical protein PSPO01_11594 [Paraphaeosphaeria sporulosa]
MAVKDMVRPPAEQRPDVLAGGCGARETEAGWPASEVREDAQWMGCGIRLAFGTRKLQDAVECTGCSEEKRVGCCADAKHVSRFTVPLPVLAAAGPWRRESVRCESSCYIECGVGPLPLLFSPLGVFSGRLALIAAFTTLA